MSSTTPATVFVIDDDEGVRASIQRLLKTVGLYGEAFGSAQDFLKRKMPESPSCLILDIRLPGMSGLEVQRKLIGAGISIPIIFVTVLWHTFLSKGKPAWGSVSKGETFCYRALR